MTPLSSAAEVATEAVVVLTTVATADEAVALVRALLDRRLVAGGTLMPGARSLYPWGGKGGGGLEVGVESLRMAFAELHPYKVPELLALPVAAGADKYLGWIATETALALT